VPVNKFEWRQSTRNCHAAYLGDTHVVSVERPQKNRSDGTKHDWRIIVLGSPFGEFDKTFTQNDPRDLESTKLAAEARAKWAIGVLYTRLTT